MLLLHIDRVDLVVGSPMDELVGGLEASVKELGLLRVHRVGNIDEDSLESLGGRGDGSKESQESGDGEESELHSSLRVGVSW